MFALLEFARHPAQRASKFRNLATSEKQDSYHKHNDDDLWHSESKHRRTINNSLPLYHTETSVPLGHREASMEPKEALLLRLAPLVFPKLEGVRQKQEDVLLLKWTDLPYWASLAY